MQVTVTELYSPAVVSPRLRQTGGGMSQDGAGSEHASGSEGSAGSIRRQTSRVLNEEATKALEDRRGAGLQRTSDFIAVRLPSQGGEQKAVIFQASGEFVGGVVRGRGAAVAGVSTDSAGLYAYMTR